MSNQSERKFVFILNPTSAAGTTRQRFEAVRRKFEATLGDVQVRLTEAPGHATELANQARLAGADVVVAVGGDGTLNEVAQGLLNSNGERIPEAPMLGVYPSGTGGDFRRTFGWGTDPEEILARLNNGQPREIDAGWLTCTGEDGAQVGRAFVNISSFGLSGAVDHVVNNSSKALGGKASFLLGTIRAVSTYKAPAVRVSINDGDPVEQKVSLCVLGNGQYFGGGMWIAPSALIDDGELEGVLFGDVSLSWWITKGTRVYAGRHLDLDDVARFPCRSLSAEPVGDERIYIDLDGELPGCLPARWEIRPRALTILE